MWNYKDSNIKHTTSRLLSLKNSIIFTLKFRAFTYKENHGSSARTTQLPKVPNYSDSMANTPAHTSSRASQP